MSKHILITRKLDEAGLLPLKEAGFTFTMRESNTPYSKAELYEEAARSDAVLTFLTDHIDSAFFDANPRVKVLANYRSRYDNIDIKEATNRGIPLLYVPNAAKQAVAEFSISLLLSIVRKIPDANSFVYEGKFKRYDPSLFQGRLFSGKTLGVIGFGSVGQMVAKFGHALGMHVLYTDVDKVKTRIPARQVELDMLLSESDFLSVHLPNVPSTKRFLGYDEFNKMKKGVYVVSTSHGASISMGALCQHLQTGKVAGAAVDLLSNEMDAKSAKRLNTQVKTTPNLLLTPHIAASTVETRRLMAYQLSESIVQALQGEKPKFVVNPEVYAKKKKWLPFKGT